MCKRMTVLSLDTKYGTDLFVFEDPYHADFLLDSYVKKYWGQYFPDVEMPENFNDAVEHFFLMRGSDSYTIDDVTIIRNCGEVDQIVKEDL